MDFLPILFLRLTKRLKSAKLDSQIYRKFYTETQEDTQDAITGCIGL